jgi:hypothetical protein
MRPLQVGQYNNMKLPTVTFTTHSAKRVHCCSVSNNRELSELLTYGSRGSFMHGRDTTTWLG